jgi:hypothetical protein
VHFREPKHSQPQREHGVEEKRKRKWRAQIRLCCLVLNQRKSTRQQWSALDSHATFRQAIPANGQEGHTRWQRTVRPFARKRTGHTVRRHKKPTYTPTGMTQQQTGQQDARSGTMLCQLLQRCSGVTKMRQCPGSIPQGFDHQSPPSEQEKGDRGRRTQSGGSRMLSEKRTDQLIDRFPKICVRSSGSGASSLRSGLRGGGRVGSNGAGACAASYASRPRGGRGAVGRPSEKPTPPSEDGRAAALALAVLLLVSAAAVLNPLLLAPPAHAARATHCASDGSS